MSEEENNDLATGGVIEPAGPVMIGNGSPELVHMSEQARVVPSGEITYTYNYTPGTAIMPNPTLCNPAGPAYGGLSYYRPAINPPVTYTISALTEDRVREIISEMFEQMIEPAAQRISERVKQMIESMEDE